MCLWFFNSSVYIPTHLLEQKLTRKCSSFKVAFSPTTKQEWIYTALFQACIFNVHNPQWPSFLPSAQASCVHSVLLSFSIYFKVHLFSWRAAMKNNNNKYFNYYWKGIVDFFILQCRWSLLSQIKWAPDLKIIINTHVVDMQIEKLWKWCPFFSDLPTELGLGMWRYIDFFPLWLFIILFTAICGSMYSLKQFSHGA